MLSIWGNKAGRFCDGVDRRSFLKIGGLAMGWWLDKRGVMEPVLFGAVMIAMGSFLAAQSGGKWSLYLANGILIGLLGKAAMIAPLIANATRWFDRRRGLAASAAPHQ